MREAGFSYEAHKKSYYIDRHEDDDVVANRHVYINEDLVEEYIRALLDPASKEAVPQI
jgi:hypothetical protein